MSQVSGDPLDDSWSEGEPDLAAAELFGLPPDHVVVALRARTGHAHLGWRRPSDRERLQCAALLASETFDQESLTTAEAVAVFGPSRSVGTVRSSSLLTRVLETDPATAGGAEAVAAVLAVEELLSTLHAAQAGYLSRLAEPGVVGDPTGLATAPQGKALSSDSEVTEPAVLLAAFQLATAQLGAALCVGSGSASRRIADAQDLVHSLPAVRDALCEGRIDPRRARILMDRSAVLSFELRTEVAARLLPLAAGCTPLRWVSMVDAAVIAADPVGAEARRRDALERRRLRLERADDGMAKFIAELSAPDAQLAWDLFDAIGRALQGMDDRCVDHRRADAFATMIELLAAGESVSVAGLIELAVAMDHETCCDSGSVEQQPAGEDGTTLSGADVPGAEKADEPGHGDGTVRGGSTAAAPESAAPSEAGTSVDDPAPDDDLVRGGLPVGTSEAVQSGPGSPVFDVADDSHQQDPVEDRTRPTVAFEASKAWDPICCNTCGSLRDCSGSATRWTMPTRQGRRTHATVVLTLDTLAAIVNDPAALIGHGVITAELARSLAQAASTISLLVGDPKTGAILGAGSWKYRPRQEVRDQVVTAYPTCIFTGCDRPGVDCDLDHRKSFKHLGPREGGATTARTMFPLCRLHHRLKTHGGWTYVKGDRTVTFRSPLGLVSTTRQIDPVILHGFRADGPEPPDTPPPF